MIISDSSYSLNLAYLLDILYVQSYHIGAHMVRDAVLVVASSYGILFSSVCILLRFYTEGKHPGIPCRKSGVHIHNAQMLYMYSCTLI